MAAWLQSPEQQALNVLAVIGQCLSFVTARFTRSGQLKPGPTGTTQA